MKTTLDLSDALVTRAKRHAQKTGQPLRAVVEQGLRLVLSQSQTADGPRYRMRDCSVGSAGAENPLEALSWQDLRAHIYGEV